MSIIYRVRNVNNEIDILFLIPMGNGMMYDIGYDQNNHIFYIRTDVVIEHYILEPVDSTTLDYNIFSIVGPWYFSTNCSNLLVNQNYPCFMFREIGVFCQDPSVFVNSIYINIKSNLKIANIRNIYDSLMMGNGIDRSLVRILFNCLQHSPYDDSYNEEAIRSPKLMFQNIFKATYSVSQDTIEETPQNTSEKLDMCPECDYKNPYICKTLQLRSGDEASEMVYVCKNGHFKNSKKKETKLVTIEHVKMDDSFPDWFKEIITV